MTHKNTLTAELRDKAGKGVARDIRRTGKVPAVIYGDKKSPVMITLSAKDLVKPLNDLAFFNSICDLKVGKDSFMTIPRDVQLDPISDRPIHLDFLRVGKGTVLDLEIPVHFTNEEASVGIKRGGVLNVVHHTITLRCSPDNIPENIIIDISGLDIGDSVHLDQVKLPAGVKPIISEDDLTIATLVAPSAMKSEEDEEAKKAEDAAAAEGAEGAPKAEGDAAKPADSADKAAKK